MKKEATADAVEALAQQGGQHQEVVVMDPYTVTLGGCLLHKLITEYLQTGRGKIKC